MLHILSSSLHSEVLSLPFEVSEEWSRTHQAVAVLTGGSESLFLSLVEKGEIELTRPVYLLVSQQSNSLAAAMEILSWIKIHHGQGQILTSADDIGSGSNSVPTDAIAQPSGQDSVLAFGRSAFDDEGETSDRIGLIGRPSDWLIASDFDRDVLRERLHIEVVDIPIEEVTSLGKVDLGLAGANAIYDRIRGIIARYQLTAVSLRCFDLLTTVENTGCIALSRLNDEGIPASCEGDIPTLVTMILSKRMTGCPGFQANPARIEPETGRMLFAHCTLPLSMTHSHSLTTHFESGIGVAIHGELPEGEYTLMKVSGDLSRVFCEQVTLVRNQYEANLCRTQVWLQSSPEVARRLLTEPIANHHVLVPGHVSINSKHL